MHKKVSSLVGVILGLMLLASLTSAGSIGADTAEITSGQVLQCSGSTLVFNFTPVASSGGVTINNLNATLHVNGSNGSVAPIPVSLTSNSAYPVSANLGSAPVEYVELYYTVNGVISDLIIAYCDGRIEIIRAGAGEDAPRDARLNYANGDLINVLYRSTDSAGKGSVVVYSLDANSKGVYEGRFAYALFEPYLGNPPARNTLLGTIDQSSLYALTSGEFQIVVTDPLEGKTYTTIFTAFPITGVYFR
jgi:hypothetical protein